MATIEEIFAAARAAHNAGDYSGAESLYTEVLRTVPAHAEALNWSGVLAHQQGQSKEGIAIIRRAIAVAPFDAAYHANIGEILRALGRLEEAKAACQEAVRLNPGYALGHNNLGVVYREEGLLDEAAACYRRALECDPGLALPYRNLGEVLLQRQMPDESIACNRRAIELGDNSMAAHNNLGMAYFMQGDVHEAIVWYRRAAERDADGGFAISNVLFASNFGPEQDQRAIYEEHRRWNDRYARPFQRLIRPCENDRTAERRLRIGYVSPDFRLHPVGRFVLPLLEAHDHEKFEIFCYASQRISDRITDRSRTAADVWHEAHGVSDELLADVIREDRIDILVDLTMHAKGNRLLVFARKPAPVQVTYLAYCGTTGLETIDYRLTDPYLDPPSVGIPPLVDGEQRLAEAGTPAQRFYVEESAWLPETYWCYLPPDEAPPVESPPVLSTGKIAFGCLNNFSKVSAPVLAVWGSLLQAVPGSRLVLHASQGSHRDRVVESFARQGVAPERVCFVPLLPISDYFRTYHTIDIALDTFPYCGGTTTCDALWMGVPVVTLAGRTAVGRGGVSILSNLSLGDLVAYDEQQYERIAARLAAEPERLRSLRRSLRDRMRGSVLMDSPRFARNFEAAYRTMWRLWCGGSESNAGE